MWVCAYVYKHTGSAHHPSRSEWKRENVRGYYYRAPAHCLLQTTKALSVTIRMNVYLVFISRNGSVFHLENDSEGNCYAATAADYTTTRLRLLAWDVYSFSLKPPPTADFHSPPESHFTPSACPNENVHLLKIQGVHNFDVFFSIRVFVIYNIQAEWK